jgi:hypothetical protein
VLPYRIKANLSLCIHHSDTLFHYFPLTVSLTPLWFGRTLEAGVGIGLLSPRLQRNYA